MALGSLLARLKGVCKTGKGLLACCPAHDDQNPSLSIGWKDGNILLHCFAGCSTEDVVRAMGLTMRDLFDDGGANIEQVRAKYPVAGPSGSRGLGKPSKPSEWGKVVATYIYEDADGKPLHYVERTTTKQFPQGRFEHGRQVKGLGDVKTVPYRLPRLLAAPLDRVVYLTEGEKDVHAFEAQGLLASCNPGGALKFREHHAEPLRGRPVVIVMDRDEPGEKHALQVARLLAGIASSVRIVRAKTGKDAHDHFAAGHSVEEFEEVDMSELEAELPPSAISGNDTSSPGSNAKDDKSAVEVLEEILERQMVEYWHDEDERPLMTLNVEGKVRHAEIGTGACDDLLSRAYYRDRKKALSEAALTAATRNFRARAVFDGTTRTRARRIAVLGDEVYLALLDPEQRVARISGTGWSVVKEDACPIRFVRDSGARPLPVPIGGGDLGRLLSEVVNVEPEHLPLISAFLVGVFLPVGTMPVLVVSGQQGSGKTVGSRTIRGLVDPQSGGLQRLPRDLNSLMAIVNAADILAFDNISKISEELSDYLCSIASGIAIDARKLYTNKEIERVYARKPMVLNGIGDIVTKPDLMERALFASFRTLPESDRKSERELSKRLEELAPLILGAILDRVSRAIRDQEAMANPGVRLNDFGRWALAACSSDAEREVLSRALADNRERLHVATIDNDEFAQAVAAWVEEIGETTMTATEILRALSQRIEPTGRKVEGWPTRAETVGKALARLAPTLGGLGIEVKQLPRSGRSRPWRLRWVSGASQVSQPSPRGPVEPTAPDQIDDSPNDGLGDEARDTVPTASLFEPVDDSSDRCDGSDDHLEVIIV